MHNKNLDPTNNKNNVYSTCSPVSIYLWRHTIHTLMHLHICSVESMKHYYRLLWDLHFRAILKSFIAMKLRPHESQIISDWIHTLTSGCIYLLTLKGFGFKHIDKHWGKKVKRQLRFEKSQLVMKASRLTGRKKLFLEILTNTDGRELNTGAKCYF